VEGKMPIATLTSKGQTTIPREIREKLHLKAGDKLSFTLLPNGTVIMRVKNKNILDLAGVLHDPSRPPVSLQEMQVAIEETAVDRYLKTTGKTAS
jgi:antitoxin PrlF